MIVSVAINEIAVPRPADLQGRYGRWYRLISLRHGPIPCLGLGRAWCLRTTTLRGRFVCNKKLWPVRKQHKNGGGRPDSGKGFTISVRLQPDQLAALDAWIAWQKEPRPSRAEAIRRLIAKALGRK
jgi:hypothetical protein